MVQPTVPTSNASRFSCVTTPVYSVGACGIHLISTAASAVAALARKIAAFIAYLFSPITCLINRCFNRAQPVQTQPTQTTTTTPTQPTPFVPYVPTPENTRVGADFLLHILEDNPEVLASQPNCMDTPESARKFFARYTVGILSFSEDNLLADPQNLPFFVRRTIGGNAQDLRPNWPTFVRSFTNLRNDFNGLSVDDQDLVLERFAEYIPENQTPLFCKYTELLGSIQSAYDELSDTQKGDVIIYLDSGTLPVDQDAQLTVVNLMIRLRQAVKDSVHSSFNGLALEDQGPARAFLRGTLEENASRADSVDGLFEWIREAFLELVPETLSSGENNPMDNAVLPSNATLQSILRAAIETNFMSVDDFLVRANTLAENIANQNVDFIASANEARTRHLESLTTPQPSPRQTIPQSPSIGDALLGTPQPSVGQTIPQSPSIGDVLRSPMHSSTAGQGSTVRSVAEVLLGSTDAIDFLVQLLQARREAIKPENRPQLQKQLEKNEESSRKLFAQVLVGSLTKGCSTPLSTLPPLPSFMNQEISSGRNFIDAVEAIRLTYHAFSKEERASVVEKSKNSRGLDSNSSDPAERFVCEANLLIQILVENNAEFARVAADAKVAFLAEGL